MGCPVEQFKLGWKILEHLFALGLGLNEPGRLCIFIRVIVTQVIACSLQKLDFVEQILALALSYDLLDVIWESTPCWSLCQLNSFDPLDELSMTASFRHDESFIL